MSKAKSKAVARNNVLFDKWSIVHLLTGVAMGGLVSPVPAIVIMVLWEPLEIFVLSPLLKRINITFGYETLRNSLSDIFFDIVGVLIGFYILSAIVTPPFRLLSKIAG